MDKDIRNDKWNGTVNSLKDKLDAIPFTSKQRNDINYFLIELEELFRDVNKNS